MAPHTQTGAAAVIGTGIGTGEDERQRSSVCNAAEAEALRLAAMDLAASLSWLPGTTSSGTFAKRCEKLAEDFENIFKGVDAAYAQAPKSEDLLWLRDNAQQLSSATRQLASELGPLTNLPHVINGGAVVPRVLAIARAFLEQADGRFNKSNFTAFCLAFEETTPLEFHEIGALVPAVKLVVLEEIAARGSALVKNPVSEPTKRVTTSIRTLRHVTQTSWKEELEALIPFDPILREDPAGAYAAMDIESRNVYRERIAKIAHRSDRTELEVAKEALALARRARARSYDDPRIALRESHIGYYLAGEGEALLRERVGFRPTLGEGLRLFLRSHPDDFLVLGVAVLTLVIITGAALLLTPVTTSPLFVLLSMLVLLLPASQAAVQVMNYLTTNLMPVEALPKLDFSEGIPNDCVTMVAIPTLLLNEKQVQGLVENLEVRFLGNHDRNLHFAIVSDLPDSDQPAPEESSLVGLCGRLISELNERYSGKNMGSFFFSIAIASITRGKGDGWGGSASVENCST